MDRMLTAVLFAAVLFVGILLLMETGRRVGRRRLSREAEGASAGLGAVEGAVFALLGLMIAFTFSGAASRFDQRRQLVVQEANAIGTAWLRIDLLPANAQGELRALFRQYLDARLAVYKNASDRESVRAALGRANASQSQIWARATAASQAAPSPLTAQIIPALNEMFDIATTRTMAAFIHPPTVVFLMLGVLVLMSGLLAGHGMAQAQARSWLHVLGFALIMATTCYLILDLEFPRLGLIRIDAIDKVLIDLRQSMGN